MWRAARLPWPIAAVTVRSDGTMSPPAKTPGAAGHHVAARPDDAVVELDAGDVVEQRQVGVLAEREDDAVGGQLLELAGRLGEAGLVELASSRPGGRRRRA